MYPSRNLIGGEEMLQVYTLVNHMEWLHSDILTAEANIRGILETIQEVKKYPHGESLDFLS